MQPSEYVLELEIPGLPSTPNARQHFRAKAREIKKWRLTVASFARLKKPQQPLTKVKITFTRCSSVEPDYDNMVASFKGVQDGLIDGGIIIDDTRETIREFHYGWEKRPRCNGAIKIKVEGIVGADE